MGKKKNLLIESISHAVTILVIIGFLVYRYNTNRILETMKRSNKEAWAIQSSLAVEQKMDGFVFPAFPLVGEDGESSSIHELIGKNKINILLITTLEGCDACRDLELQRWGRMAREDPIMQINLIVVDAQPDTPQKFQSLIASGKAVSGLPVFFDNTGLILEELGLIPSETPVVFFVSEAGETRFAYKGNSLAQNRSDQFASVIRYAALLSRRATL